MSEVTKQWSIGGGSLTLNFDGSGAGAITMTSTKNEGVDRSIRVTVKTSDNAIKKNITITQAGLREAFNTKDQGTFNASNGEFYVLK